MRRGRWLILAAILSIIAFVGVTYLNRMRTLAKDAPAAPPPLDLALEGRANNWCYTQTDGERPRVKVCAATFKQIKQPSIMDLTGVSLWLYHKNGNQYDLVKSEKAQFDIPGKSLYSDGEVEITLGMDEDGPPAHGRLIGIRTSGVHFASDTGVAVTDRPVTFQFDQGGGSATGAEYDPNARELHLRSQVVLDWRGKSAESKPMHIEAGEAFYHEREAKIVLQPWSKLTRSTLQLEGGASVVSLQDGNIQHADVQAGHGVQDDPGRKVEFGADQLALDFGDSMLIRQIEGERNARLVSTSATARTTVTADKLDLNFDIADRQSTLDTSNASGNSVAESVPLDALGKGDKPGSRTPETRILRSDVIRLKMRPGGRDIESLETAGPGTLEFVPNRAGQPKRNLKGDRIWIAYGADNRIQSFRSVNVSTRTDKPASPGKPAAPPALTESKEFLATFDPATGDLARVEQKTGFHYQEGERQAHADRATLDDKTDLMTLDGAGSSDQARVWDPTGSATADRIVMNQKSGDFTADGHVASTRQPDKQGKSSAMLSTEEVLQARAQHMTSMEHNRQIHYEGNAVAWQGPDRVEAQTLDIDRQRQIMKAHGNVVSQFADKDKTKDSADDPKSSKPEAAPVFTVVRAPDLLYTDETRVAFYQGGALLTRPGLTVSSRELRAFLKSSDSDSSLDKALADGAVKIVSSAPNSGGQTRTRTGTSEHAEYYADEGKVILQGGEPLLVDSIKGRTTGKQLTWWANDDRLLVNGAESNPAKSVVRKKK